MHQATTKHFASANPRHFDPAMAEALRLCIRDDLQYLNVTLSLPKGYSVEADRQDLVRSLEWFTERLSRHVGRRKRARWLQTLFVLERPERSKSDARDQSGTYHPHIHGLIEVPKGMSAFRFVLLARKIWQMSGFYRSCNNDYELAPDPTGWLGYISKRGSRDPKTNYSTFNELLYESFRPITPAATVALPTESKRLTG